MTAADQLRSIGAPVWLTVIVVMTSFLLSISKEAGRIPGILGAASRWWHTRQEREVLYARDLSKTIDEVVRERVEAELAPIRDRMQRMEDRLQSAEEEVALRDEYILLQARHTRNIQEWAIEHGYELPPPPAPPRFTQWVIDKKRRDGDAPQRE